MSIKMNQCRRMVHRQLRLSSLPGNAVLSRLFSDDSLHSRKPRFSQLNIPMLSPELHAQVFGSPPGAADPERLQAAIDHLTEHNLWGRPADKFEEPPLEVPPLIGGSLESHFHAEAERQCSVYRSLLQRLVAAEAAPPPPQHWQLLSGWTRYDRDGSWRPVAVPECDALVFDVEVVVRRRMVAMATAVSDTAWYSWVSPHVVEGSVPVSDRPTLEQLIPMDNHASTPRVVVGHNVSFDRQWVREQYGLEPTGTRFVDTMSMHIAVGGITSQQRAMMMGAKAAEAKNRPRRIPSDLDWMTQTSMNSLADVYRLYCGGTLDKDARSVFIKGDVADVLEDFQHLMRYCAGDSAATWEVLKQLLPEFLERFPHPVSLAGSLQMGQVYLPVGPAWDRYLRLSQETYDDLQNELSGALRRVAELACHSAEGQAYRSDPWLWDLDWSTQQIKIKKTRVRKKSAPSPATPPLPERWWELPCRLLTAAEAESDHPLPDPLLERFTPLWKTREALYKKQPLLPGYPKWYRELCNKDGSGLTELTTSKRVVPKLLRLTWDGYPLHFDSRFGWGYLVPEDRGSNPGPANSDDEYEAYSTEAEDWGDGDELPEFPLEALQSLLAARGAERPEPQGVPIEEVEVRGCLFYPLPHPDGPGHNVGNPLAKHFLGQVERGTLASAGGSSAERVLRVSQTISYWRNNQDRIRGQLAVFGRDAQLPESVTESPLYRAGDQYGAILPEVKVAGTLTRRAVERTWLTASNPRADRLGSELRAMVQAPPGYHLVGADVDSQELWIAAVISDSAFARLHGSTAFSWMTLQGKKSEGTDLHSRTAQLIGVSRDLAKVLNYGRIYGGSRPFAAQVVKQQAQRLTDAEVELRVADMYRRTKGSRRWQLNARGQRALRTLQAVEDDAEVSDPLLASLLWRKPEEPWTVGQLMLLSKLSSATRNWRDLAGRPFWHGGTESFMFNKLETVASELTPATPVLGARLTRGLEPELVGDNFATSRVNWVVQSSAVDFLHLMLVCQQWLMDVSGIRGRFCISIHDEVRYLVRSEDRYRAALALQITNLLVRSMFAQRLGLDDLPQSVAFFSTVDIDRSLRKDVIDDCRTPSNPDGLEATYRVPPGEALDIHQIVERAGTSPLRDTTQRSDGRRREDALSA